MYYKSLDDLKAAGFQGFIPVSELQSGKIVSVPEEPGIYMVVIPEGFIPVFLPVGTGGHFKERDPNVQTGILESSWVMDTCVIYIGKAGGKTSSSTLRKRLKQYVRFGAGDPVGHWGGRYIWQLKDSGRLLVCWRPSAPDEDARLMESSLISGFKDLYGGQRPFANLVD